MYLFLIYNILDNKGAYNHSVGTWFTECTIDRINYFLNRDEIKYYNNMDLYIHKLNYRPTNSYYFEIIKDIYSEKPTINYIKLTFNIKKVSTKNIYDDLNRIP